MPILFAYFIMFFSTAYEICSSDYFMFFFPSVYVNMVYNSCGTYIYIKENMCFLFSSCYLFNILRLGSVNCILTARRVLYINLKLYSDPFFADHQCLRKQNF